MKILLFITGYRQLEEYGYFSTLLQRLQLNNICDIHIWCNNPNISPDIVTYFQKFNQQNKILTITTRNAGFRAGPVEAVSCGIEQGIFCGYDYVIHLHPDVFITDDKYLTEVLEKNKSNDTVFLITKSIPDDSEFFSFDFFIFKPALLKENIFKEELYSFTCWPEHYLHNMIKKYDIKWKYIKRYDNDDWSPRRIDDHLRLYHEHDLEKIKQLCETTS